MAKIVSITDTDSGDYKKAKEPKFVKMYVDHICDINNTPSGVKSVLYCMVKRMQYDSCVAIRPKILEAIANECNINGKNKIQQVRNKISHLVKIKFLKKVDTGTYAVNPFYFAKGEWADVARHRYEGIYGISFTTIMTEKGAEHSAKFIKDEEAK